MFDDREVIAEIVSTKFAGKKKKRKKREEQFSESVHCYSPTPPIGRRRPKNILEYLKSLMGIFLEGWTCCTF